MNRFPEDARVVFIGDSMTAANQILPRVIDHYEKYFPGARFFNCGISGGTAATALRFFDQDILPHRPTHAVVSFGINDSGCALLAQPRTAERLEKLKAAFEKYKKNMAALVDRLQEAGAAVILCTPAPYDEYSLHESEALPGGYALMLGYAEFIRSFARERQLPVCDHHRFLSDALQTDAFFKEDRIHPNEHGYYRMAESFLTFQGLQIDAEAPIPAYLDGWRDRVIRQRRLYGAEYMLLKDPTMTEAEKLAYIRRRVAQSDFGRPALEPFFRAYAVDKPNEETICREIHTIYEAEIRGHYNMA